MTTSEAERPWLDTVLTELTSARVPWLALARDLRTIGDGILIDLADPHVPPVMVNPFEPETGCPVQAHAERLAGLLGAAFNPPAPVAAAVRSGLLRAYADCGWDALTGAAPPGARIVPGVPAFGQLARSAVAAAADLGYDRRMRAAVRGFVASRLEPLWTGPAGRFLAGGHPADVGCLIGGRVLVTVGGVADDEGTTFLTGVLLARIADRLRTRDRPDLRVVTAADLVPDAAIRPAAAARLARLHDDLRAAGAQVILAAEPHRPGSARPVSKSPASKGKSEVSQPVLRGRRSAACGARCRDDRPCTGYELHAADLLARDAERAWFRLWAQTLLLAFLTGRPLPRVPAEVRAAWRALETRSRECVLAAVLDRAVAARAAALRPCYDPAGLTSVVATVAGRMLDEAAVPFRAGSAWVIPQLRWLHETERLNPLGGGGTRLDDIAPPLDFALAGLPDWPGIRVRDRLHALGRHPLSMAAPSNRRLARLGLLGEDGRASLDAGLATAVLGLHPTERLPYAAQVLGVGAHGSEPGWLEVVLSWPDRIIRPAWDSDLRVAPDSDLRPALSG